MLGRATAQCGYRMAEWHLHRLSLVVSYQGGVLWGTVALWTIQNASILLANGILLVPWSLLGSGSLPFQVTHRVVILHLYHMSRLCNSKLGLAHNFSKSNQVQVWSSLSNTVLLPLLSLSFLSLTDTFTILYLYSVSSFFGAYVCASHNWLFVFIPDKRSSKVP